MYLIYCDKTETDCGGTVRTKPARLDHIVFAVGMFICEFPTVGKWIIGTEKSGNAESNSVFPRTCDGTTNIRANFTNTQ